MAKAKNPSPQKTMNVADWKDVIVDLTLPRSNRPMAGLDIEEWRGQYGLSKSQAEEALGFRGPAQYKRQCEMRILPVNNELLLRLYDEAPGPCPWKRLTLRDLFELTYGGYLKVFEGRDLVRAEVDLGKRFTAIFGRSYSRKYTWLKSDPVTEGKSAGSYAVVERILSKLTQFKDPAEALERIGKRVLNLRGVDVDDLYPIPTKANPPRREKTGRKVPEEKQLLKELVRLDRVKRVKMASKKKSRFDEAARKLAQGQAPETSEQKARAAKAVKSNSKKVLAPVAKSPAVSVKATRHTKVATS